MSLFSLLFGKKQKVESYTTRLGKAVRTDAAFNAWTSGDLDKMLKAVKTKTNPIDRHFLLQSIVNITYKQRKTERYRNLCIEYAKLHLQEFPSLVPTLKEDMDGTLPRITTFQNYSTLLTEDGEFEKAISVCKQAIEYGLHDKTKSGYKGRIERIKKQSEKQNA
ncbi:hypothetical protein [Shewanella xiamenensis]|uniref:hypothetical protein n=1 Tax=Shewanella xiamenensis TaxID=332186 RepID=UPI001C4FBEC7|nr:hypothetical protein [Shewanella xiamenensis]MBW0279384.1 hypothetical protein [Shewanella xiamenensis]MCT8874198.1 hypothetical protein [Shewanella xiamenensis]UWH42040.1 hypothetical protein KXJ80_01770 [Shewanella xiamenensis]